MNRAPASRWPSQLFALAVAAIPLGLAGAVRALPAVPVDGDVAGIRTAFLVGLAVLAATASLAHLIPALRDGSIARLLTAGASATLAGGAVAVLAGATSLGAAVLVAAILGICSAFARDRQLPGGVGTRIGAAVGIMAAAEAATLVGIVPPVEEALTTLAPAIFGAAAVAAFVQVIVAPGLWGVAAALTSAGAFALGIERGVAVEGLVGVALLGCGQLLTVAATREQGPPADPVERLPDLADRLSDAVLRFDGHLRLREWNGAAGELLALDTGSLGTRIDDLLGVSLADLPSDGSTSVWRHGVGSLEVAMHRAGTGLVAVIRDPGMTPEADRLGSELRETIEELLRARRTIHLQRGELERSSTVDPLTGVASRGAILERLRMEVAQARRYRHPLGVVLLDVDRFADINSAHGIGGGDAVLREVALRMRLRVREADALGRCGSDGFLGILPHTDEAGAATFADALRHRLAQRPVHVGDETLRVTVSIGVATMRPGEDLDVDGVLARVQEALDSARSAGGDRIALDRLHGLARLEATDLPGDAPSAEPEAG